ncbi:NUDIX hydrolase, partial [Microbacterium terregens]
LQYPLAPNRNNHWPSNVRILIVSPPRNAGAAQRVGLILRHSPYGEVWCHLGGRIQRGETIADALRRHARETLQIDIELALEPQPVDVFQWFPAEVAPDDGTPYGDDARKHAIGLSFIVEHEGAPTPQGEALDFAYFSLDELPEPLWPGCGRLLGRLFSAGPRYSRKAPT